MRTTLLALLMLLASGCTEQPQARALATGATLSSAASTTTKQTTTAPKKDGKAQATGTGSRIGR